MNNETLEHDRERERARWEERLRVDTDAPVLERAYRAVVVLLVSSGLRGLNDVKTAEIARLSGINESTLFRYARKRDQLVADAVDWCWGEVNRHIAAVHHRTPSIDSTADDLIMTDLVAFLDLFADADEQLIATGALLSFRRAEQLTEASDCPHQMEFRHRLGVLARALVRDRDTGGHDPEVIATFLTHSVSTVWFTWLADPASRAADGLLSRATVVQQLRMTLGMFGGTSMSVADAPSPAMLATDDGEAEGLWSFRSVS